PHRWLGVAPALGARARPQCARAGAPTSPARRRAPHSDRGVQYASHAYRQLLRRAGFTASMSRRGDCWDNAVVESFFATLTKELLVEGPFPTRDAARHAAFAFIEVWYNRRRRHSALGYRTPAEYAKELQNAS